MRHALAHVAVSLVTALVVSGCHDDACVWTLEPVQAETTGSIRANESSVDAVVSVHARTSFDERESATTTSLSLSANVTNDVPINNLVLTIRVAEIATGTITLDATNALARVFYGETVSEVREEVPTGTATITMVDVTCEESKDPDGGSTTWECATDIDATIDATIDDTSIATTYRVSGSLEQRDELGVMCYPCEGIEGCDY
jgi:hypothetical protein